MKSMVKRFFLVSVLLLLCVCAINTLSSPEYSNDKIAVIDSKVDDSNHQLVSPSALNSNYSDVLTAYSDFLEGHAYGMDANSIITIAPSHEGKYSILDMNDDNVPELITNVIVIQYYNDDMSLSLTAFESGIFTYVNGEVVRWFNGGQKDFEVLRNRALLYDYEGQGIARKVEYVELDSNGGIYYQTCAAKIKDDNTGNYSYFTNFIIGDGGTQVASESDWLSEIELFLALKTDVIPWKNYSIETP